MNQVLGATSNDNVAPPVQEPAISSKIPAVTRILPPRATTSSSSLFSSFPGLSDKTRQILRETDGQFVRPVLSNSISSAAAVDAAGSGETPTTTLSQLPPITITSARRVAGVSTLQTLNETVLVREHRQRQQRPSASSVPASSLGSSSSSSPASYQGNLGFTNSSGNCVETPNSQLTSRAINVHHPSSTPSVTSIFSSTRNRQTINNSNNVTMLTKNHREQYQRQQIEQPFVDIAPAGACAGVTRSSYSSPSSSCSASSPSSPITRQQHQQQQQQQQPFHHPSPSPVPTATRMNGPNGVATSLSFLSPLSHRQPTTRATTSSSRRLVDESEAEADEVAIKVHTAAIPSLSLPSDTNAVTTQQQQQQQRRFTSASTSASASSSARPSSAVDRLKQMIEEAESENVERRKRRKLIQEIEETRGKAEQQATVAQLERNKEREEPEASKEEFTVSVGVGTNDVEESTTTTTVTSRAPSTVSTVSLDEGTELLHQLENRDWEQERKLRRDLLHQEQEQELFAFLEQRRLAEAFASVSWDERVARSDVEMQEKIERQEISERLFDAMMIVRQVAAVEATEKREREKIAAKWSEHLFSSMAVPFLQTVEKRVRNDIARDAQGHYAKKYRSMLYEESVVNLATEEAYAREEIFVDWEDALSDLCSAFSSYAVDALARELWMTEVSEANGRGEVENELAEFFWIATEGRRWSRQVVEKRAEATVRARQEWRQHISLLKSELVEMEAGARMLIQKTAFSEMRSPMFEEYRSRREQILNREQEDSIQRAIREAQKFSEQNDGDGVSSSSSLHPLRKNLPQEKVSATSAKRNGPPLPSDTSAMNGRRQSTASTSSVASSNAGVVATRNVPKITSTSASTPKPRKTTGPSGSVSSLQQNRTPKHGSSSNLQRH